MNLNEVNGDKQHDGVLGQGPVDGGDDEMECTTKSTDANTAVSSDSTSFGPVSTPSNPNQEFEEFLQRQADHPAFAAYHHHQQQQNAPPNLVRDISIDNQTVVSEVTLMSNMSLFRGPLYGNPDAIPDNTNPFPASGM